MKRAVVFGIALLALALSACGETKTTASDGDTQEREGAAEGDGSGANDGDRADLAEAEEELESFLVNGEVAYPRPCEPLSESFNYYFVPQSWPEDLPQYHGLILRVDYEQINSRLSNSTDTWVYSLTEGKWEYQSPLDMQREGFHTVRTLSDAAYAELLRTITSRFPPGCYDIGVVGDCCDIIFNGVSFYDTTTNQPYQIRWGSSSFELDTSALKPDDRLCPEPSALPDEVLFDYELTNLGDVTRFVLKSDKSYTFANSAKQSAGTLTENQTFALYKTLSTSASRHIFPFSCVETIDPLLCQGETKGHLYYRDLYGSHSFRLGGRFECLASSSERFQSEFAATVTKLNAFLTRLVQ